MAILNYTTKIDSYKTITEIQQILSRRGASKLVIDNDANGNPSGLTFCILWNGIPTAFMLPCNFEGVLRAMHRDKKVPRSACNEQQALRTGWRILKDWVEAQMAIVEADLMDVGSVFAQHAITKDGTPLYQYLQQNKQLLLS